jgi:5'-phosphate synthase pdxT subunit
MKDKVVGVLAIQGDFQAHAAALSRIGIDHKEIRTSSELAGITHLIVPGGESTTIRKVAQSNGLWPELARFEGPVMGTCMGSVIMANRIESPADEALGMIDMTIRRNAYGRQINSLAADGRVKFSNEPFEMVFIRAPRIMKTGKNVEPIAWLGDEVTGVMERNKIALTFHPELSDSIVIHEFFISLT